MTCSCRNGILQLQILSLEILREAVYPVTSFLCVEMSTFFRRTKRVFLVILPPLQNIHISCYEFGQTSVEIHSRKCLNSRVEVVILCYFSGVWSFWSSVGSWVWRVFWKTLHSSVSGLISVGRRTSHINYMESMDELAQLNIHFLRLAGCFPVNQLFSYLTNYINYIFILLIILLNDMMTFTEATCCNNDKYGTIWKCIIC